MYSLPFPLVVVVKHIHNSFMSFLDFSVSQIVIFTNQVYPTFLLFWTSSIYTFLWFFNISNHSYVIRVICCFPAKIFIGHLAKLAITNNFKLSSLIFLHGLAQSFSLDLICLQKFSLFNHSFLHFFSLIYCTASLLSVRAFFELSL